MVKIVRFFGPLFFSIFFFIFNMNALADYLIISVNRVSDISRTLTIIKNSSNNTRGHGIFVYSKYGASKEELEFFDKIDSKVIQSSDPLYKEILRLSNKRISAKSKMEKIYDDFTEGKSDGEEYSEYDDKAEYCSSRIMKILHNLVK